MKAGMCDPKVRKFQTNFDIYTDALKTWLDILAHLQKIQAPLQ